MRLKSLNIFEAEYSVIDFETTGLSPSKNRIIEIGIVKINNGKITGTFNSFVNPGFTVPPYITELTGISNEDLLTAPAFEDVAGEMLEFIGDSVIVAHNYSFDVKFLNTELKRAGYSPVANPLMCTLRLSKKLFPNLRSKSLGNVAQYLNIKHRDVHRALGDATVTAKVFLKQLQILRDDFEIENIEELISFAALSKKPEFFIIKKRLANDFNRVSFNPGVYLFKDNKGEIIYIGKAKSLRNRVKNHFAYNAVSKSKEIIRRANSLEFIETNSELSALIAEAELIKKHSPRFNVMLKQYPRAHFVKLENANKLGGVSVVSKIDFDGNDYFGPYSSRETAAKIVEIINVSFKLRECKEREFKKGRVCYLYDIGRCLAPCVNGSIREEYFQEVEKVKSFFNGNHKEVIGNLIFRMKKFSDERKYEQAAEIRDYVNMLLNELEKINTIKESINKAKLLGVVREGSRQDFFLLINGKIVFKDENLNGEDEFFTTLRDYYTGTVSLFRQIEKPDIERLKITLSWLSKNKTKVKLFNLNDYSSEKELFLKSFK